MWDWLLRLPDVGLGGEVTIRLTNMWPLWLAFLATVAAVVFVVFVYRRDGGTRFGRAVGGVLRSLLLVLLLLLIWQPVIRIEHTYRDPGVVAVMIDVSGSMAATDRYAADDPLVARLLEVRTGRSPADGDAPTTRPDASPDDLLAELTSVDRLGLVRRLVGEEGFRSIAELLANNDVQLYAFGQDAEPLVRLNRRWPDQGDQGRAADDDKLPLSERLKALDKLSPDRAATSLGQALGRALASLRGQRLAAVVVLSDGRSTVDSDLGAAIEQAQGGFRTPVPVHTVVVGSIHPPRDLAVSRVLVEPVVFVKDLVAVRATVIQHGYDAPQQVIVKLFEQSPSGGPERQLAQEAVTVGARDRDGQPIREVETELRFQPQASGEYRLAVRVEPPAGDLNPANNVSVAPLAVKDAKIRVLYVEGYPRWEYRFLVHSLIREQTVTISSFLFSADDEFVQEGNDPITRLPQTAEEWAHYDVILFGDVNPFDVTLTQMEQIEQFVRERGGGFAMIAGDQFSPQRYVASPLARPLVKLLTVDPDPSAGPDAVNRVSGFHFTPTADGLRSPILRFERDPKRNEDTIKAFPELYWYKTVLGLRPGVEVLAVHPVARTPDGQLAPLLVVGRYGAGKTCFCATDETWRWRRETGVPFFDTYWLQLVRWLSRSKLLGFDRRFELSTSQAQYDRGQPVRLEMRILDRALSPLPDKVAALVNDQSGAQIGQVELVRAGLSGDLYAGTFKPQTDGEFGFPLSREEIGRRFGLGGGDDRAMPRVQVQVVPSSRENRQLAIDADSMRYLAARTGGQSVTLADLGKLADTIPDLSRPIENDRDLPLWDTRLALILFALIITGEWILRKYYNLQ